MFLFASFHLFSHHNSIIPRDFCILRPHDPLLGAFAGDNDRVAGFRNPKRMTNRFRAVKSFLNPAPHACGDLVNNILRRLIVRVFVSNYDFAAKLAGDFSELGPLPFITAAAGRTQNTNKARAGKGLF